MDEKIPGCQNSDRLLEDTHLLVYGALGLARSRLKTRQKVADSCSSIYFNCRELLGLLDDLLPAVECQQKKSAAWPTEYW